MKKIYLSGKLGAGKFALVDDSDYENLLIFKWFSDCRGYAWGYKKGEASFSKRSVVKMHRLIMDAKPGEEVDHIFGDKLDNRKASLRICTREQNSQNMPKNKGSSSIYKGVFKYKRKWKATINANHVEHKLGYFFSEKEAAIAYNEAAKKYHGEFAVLNVVSL